MTRDDARQDTCPGLLRLPPHLRHRIYRFTGVARFDDYRYTYHLDGRKESRGFWSDEPGLLFSGLLLTCRVVYAEVAALLYSANRFVIVYARQRSLVPLRALSPTALASLATLKIVLNESACHRPMDSIHYPPPCCHDRSKYGLESSKSHCAQYHGGKHDRPLLLDPASDADSDEAKLAVQAMLAEWRDTAAHLASRIGTATLALSLVTFSRRARGYQLVRPMCRLGLETEFPPHIMKGCRLTRCPQCHYCDDGQPSGHGCFCRRLHAAFSLTCKCWAPPPALFLICRSLREDAEFVFFTTNRFIVCDGDQLYPWRFPRDEEDPDPEAYPFERFAASMFLRDIVPAHCLTHLRFVELVFPPYNPEVWPQRDHPARLDWYNTVRWLRDKIKAPALTIRFVMAEFYCIRLPPHRDLFTKEEGHAIVRGWADIMHALSPLARVDGLGGFYVQTNFPRHSHDQWLARIDKDRKEYCERGVRGIKKGEALPPCAKPEPSKSTWQRLYLQHLDYDG
ncbi:hypothetical protein C8A05DRAFT_43477 [Staphylotrichum tortipilum]|uniref:Uncharacterized protein n=1 Tax=Staphylotrichum tortipilum TaxID=2831512 RepID=A0AAN6MNM8_9PEZI|nr:hypothetical protein C8A05DRAFT_43477 [Staphylotrichum longicolle]